MPGLKTSVGQFLPRRLLVERHKIRRLGLAKYVGYTRIEMGQRRLAWPEADEPFMVAPGARPILLDETTLPSARVHWRTQAHPVKEFRAFKRLVPGHQLLLDIGAGRGIFSAAFCAMTGQQAWAFEPSAETYPNVVALIAKNPELDIRAFNIGLGNETGEKAMRTFPGGQMRAVNEGATDVMMVRTLDRFVEEHGIRPDIAKLDIEGMELEALRGGEKTFRENIRTLVFELHYSMLTNGETVHDAQSLIRNLGFQMYDLDLEPIRDLASYIEAEPEVIRGYTIIVCRK